MSVLESAARRVLESAALEPGSYSGRAAILASAAIALESERPGASASLIERVRARSLAFIAATAVEAWRPSARREALVDFAASIPPSDRAAALAGAECFLARIEPEWAASVVERFAGAEGIAASGVLGLSIAAFANDDPARLPRWVISPPPSRVVYSRALAADRVARAAVRGVITDRSDPAFEPLQLDPGARLLLPFEASAYLVAAAVVDASWALQLASAMLRAHSPLDMTDALYFVARCATRNGLRQGVAAQCQAREFVLEQACWIEAAARGGALDPSEVSALCAAQADRVLDDLQDESATDTALALLMALAHAGSADLLIELARRWRVAPEAIAECLFYSGASKCALALIDHPQFEACRDLLALTGSLAWLATPSSLLDLVCVASRRDTLLRD